MSGPIAQLDELLHDILVRKRTAAILAARDRHLDDVGIVADEPDLTRSFASADADHTVFVGDLRAIVCGFAADQCFEFGAIAADDIGLSVYNHFRREYLAAPESAGIIPLARGELRRGEGVLPAE